MQTLDKGGILGTGLERTAEGQKLVRPTEIDMFVQISLICAIPSFADRHEVPFMFLVKRLVAGFSVRCDTTDEIGRH